MTRNDFGITIYPACSTLNKSQATVFHQLCMQAFSLRLLTIFKTTPTASSLMPLFQFSQFCNLIRLSLSADLPSSMSAIHPQIGAFDTYTSVPIPKAMYRTKKGETTH